MLTPTVPELLEQAQAAADAGALSEATALWDEALQRARARPRAYLAIIRHHLARGRRGEVTRAYRLLSALAPDLVAYAPFEPPAEAGAQASGATASSAEEHFQRGQLMQIVGEIEQAEHHFRASAALGQPGDARAVMALQLLKPWSDGAATSAGHAMALFAKAYERDLESEDHRRSGGLNGHLTLGRLAGAHAALKATACDLLYYEATLLHRAHLLTIIGTAYAAALGLDPDEVAWIAEVKKAVHGRDLLDDASDIYEGITRVQPHHAMAWYALGLVKLMRPDLRAAERCLERSYAVSRGLQPWAMMRLAVICEIRHDYRKAADLFQAATTALGGDIGAYHRNAGRCLRLAGRVAEALPHYQKAMGWSRWLGPEFFVNPLPIAEADLDAFWRYVNTAAAKSACPDA